MIKFPASTLVNKVVPKNAFYKHLEMNVNMKEHFINDVDRIVWAYKFAPSTLNVIAGKSVEEITIFTVNLKIKECPSDVFVFIDKNLPRHTAFILTFEKEQSVLINYKEHNSDNASMPFKVTRTYQSLWKSVDNCDLTIEGSTLDAIYENMVRQVAGSQISGSSKDLKKDIEASQELEKIKKEISALKAKANAEKQPQKKFMLHKKIKELENKIR